MRIPAFLPAGGTISFAAPSFGCAEEPYHSCFLRARTVLSDMGYRLKTGPNCLLAEGIGISNTPEKCGDEINACFADPEADAVISVGGGELMCETMDYVDFEAIKQLPPKWFMGFSDNTNLSFLLPTLCDTAAVYGPNAPVFGADPRHQIADDGLALLSGKTKTIKSYGMWEKESLKDEEHPFAPYNLTEPTMLKVWHPGMPEDASCDTYDTAGAVPPQNLSGRMLGGCLDILNGLAGTTFDKVPAFIKRYKKDGILWFFESCDLSVFDMRRALWHLEHCGWFTNVKGFLIGRPLHYGEEMMGLNQYLAVTAILGKYNVPIIMDADLGHLAPSMPIVEGVKADLTAEGHEITIQFKY